PVSARRGYGRQDSARGEAGRTPGRAANQIRSGHKSDHRQGARPYNSGVIPAARRRGDRVKRRTFITLPGGTAGEGPAAARAQQQTKIARIGILGLASAAAVAPYVNAVRAGLRDLGYIEGKNLIIEYRFGDGNYDRLPNLAVELVHLNVAV